MAQTEELGEAEVGATRGKLLEFREKSEGWWVKFCAFKEKELK